MAGRDGRVGTADYTEAQPAALVTRGTIIGVVPVSIDTGKKAS